MEFKKGIAATLLASSLASGCHYSSAEADDFELNAALRPVEHNFDIEQLSILDCDSPEQFNQVKDLAMQELEYAHFNERYTNISELFSFLISCVDNIGEDVSTSQQTRFFNSIVERPDLVGSIMYETYYSSPDSVDVAFKNIDSFKNLENRSYWQNRVKRNLAESLWRDVYTGNDEQVEQLLDFFDESGPVTQTEMRALIDDALLERTTVELLNGEISDEKACQIVEEVKHRGLADKLYKNEFGSVFDQANYGQNFRGVETIFFDRMVSCDSISD